MEEFNHVKTVHKGSDLRRSRNRSTALSFKKESAIAYLGPEGTFTHEAALSVYGHRASYQACAAIEDIFQGVEKGLPSRGVVPVENAYAGSVHITLDLLYTRPVMIQGEILSRIHQHLLSQAPAVEQIKHVYSHPMAIAQCNNWLNNHMPHVPVSEVSSTAMAVKKATGKPHAAAIGSRFAGIIHGLASLKENIEDNKDNVTRFFVLGKEQPKPTGKDKTSLVFMLNHRAGALYQVMKVLTERSIGVTRLETRPEKTKKWERLFYIDMEGHKTDHPVAHALTAIEKQCTFFKILGSYPACEDPGRIPDLNRMPGPE